jgi:hypothetical protein
MDLSLLEGPTGDEIVTRLRGAMGPLVSETERAISSTDTAQHYEKTYERVTPYVLLPIPVGMSERSFAESGVLNRIGHLIVAGRVKAFDVYVGDPPGSSARKRSAAWKRKLFGRAFYQPPVNGSPLKQRRLISLFDELESEILSGLRRWVEKFTLFEAEPKAGYYYLPLSTLGNEPPPTFISYSSANIARVQPIAEIVAAGGPEVWFAATSIQDGEDWIDEVSRALRNCEQLVAFCSKDYYASRPCRQELKVFSKLKRPMLPVVLDGSNLEGVVLDKLYRVQIVPAASLNDAQLARRILAWLDRCKRKRELARDRSM